MKHFARSNNFVIINSVAISDNYVILKNIVLEEPKKCGSCGASIETIKKGKLCDFGHLWHDCECESTLLEKNYGYSRKPRS